MLNEFWVDAYINPQTALTAVNQTWNTVGAQGLTWGITATALSGLQPGGVLTLTLGDRYYRPSLSQVNLPLAIGTPVYAQVDSFNAQTTYGAVLEFHEIMGAAYNNINGPVSAALILLEVPPLIATSIGQLLDDLYLSAQAALPPR